jgi:hypothetical protein
LCSAETTAHIFTIMEAFLSIPDGLVKHRALSMFAGEVGPLSMLMSIQDQAPKGRLVCVCIRSLMTLVQRVPSVQETLTTPIKIQTWAPWMLKFCFRFVNKYEKEANDSAIAKSIADASSSSMMSDVSIIPPLSEQKGSYIIVYGEREEEREILWIKRAEDTLELLRDVLISSGAQPDALIPEDTFTTPSPPDDDMPSLITVEEDLYSAGNTKGSASLFKGSDKNIVDLSKDDGIDAKATQGTATEEDNALAADGMTDEQFAEWISKSQFE